MKKHSNKNKIKAIICITLSAILACVCGFFAGQLITDKAFPIDNYLNINGDDLRDDLSALSVEGKTPDDFSGAIAFQLAEEVLLSSTNYMVVGVGTIETSLGVSQTSYTEDWRNGDDVYIGFTTYSSFVKASKQANFKIGGDVLMLNGTPNDSTLSNVDWGDGVNYTWEGYKEAFGKYPNRNCCYVVSSSTVVSDSGFTKEDGLYKCSLVLNPTLGGSNYAKQVGTNMGVDYKKVTFNEIRFTFWLDEDFKFVKQQKYESYTVPYAGIELTMFATIETNFDIT